MILFSNYEKNYCGKTTAKAKNIYGYNDLLKSSNRSFNFMINKKIIKEIFESGNKEDYMAVKNY